jgi:GAF domain-containing protein
VTTNDMQDHLDVKDALPAGVLADLARIVLAEETLDSVLSRVVGLTKQVISAAEEVSLTLVRRNRAETAAYTGPMAMQADERQYARDGGPCLDAARGGALLHIRDMRSEDRWPAYAPQAVRVGVLSSLSVPLPIQEDLVGALNVYSGRPHAFSGRDVEAGKAFAAYAAIAVGNADTFATTTETAEHLRVAMASRATIEQAKGIVMARGGISPDEAFGMLVRVSQRENRKLRDVAGDLVERVQKRPPGKQPPSGDGRGGTPGEGGAELVGQRHGGDAPVLGDGDAGRRLEHEAPAGDATVEDGELHDRRREGGAEVAEPHPR